MPRFTSPLNIFAIVVLLILCGFILWPKERTASERQSNLTSSAISHQGEQQTETQNSSLPSQAQSHPKSSQAQAEELPSSTKVDDPPVQEEGDVRKLTIKQLIDLSTRIVLAKCRAVNVREAASGNIFTFSEFEAHQVLKGAFPNKNFTLRLLGGRIGDVEISSETMPKFTPDTEFVLFLGRDNAAGHPTIFPQGVFRVMTDSATRKKFVTPKPQGIPLFRAQDKRPYSHPPDSLSLDDFIFSLQKLISER
jgi:hypothetical protein